MATDQEIRTALNRLIAAKLRLHASDINKLADQIEGSEREPDKEILADFDALDERRKKALIRAAEIGLGIIEGGKGNEGHIHPVRSPLQGLTNPSPIDGPEGA